MQREDVAIRIGPLNVQLLQRPPGLAPDLPPCSSTTPAPEQHKQELLHPPQPRHQGPPDHQQPTPADPATASSAFSPSHCLLGWELWPAACLLAQHLATDPHTRDLLLQARAVCELGAGLGLPGIVAALLGARHVALTDLPQALPLLATNVERNGVGHVCSMEQLDWGAWVSGSGSGGPGAGVCSGGSKGGIGAEEGEQQQQRQQQEEEVAQHAERVRQRHESSYDVVLAADVVYVSALAPLLADVVAGVLAAGGVAIVGHTVRKSVWLDRTTGNVARDTEDEPWKLFEQRMTRVHGFTCSRVGSRAAATAAGQQQAADSVGQRGVQGAAGGVGGGQEAAVMEVACGTACYGDGGEGEHEDGDNVFVCVFHKLPVA